MDDSALAAVAEGRREKKVHLGDDIEWGFVKAGSVRGMDKLREWWQAIREWWQGGGGTKMCLNRTTLMIKKGDAWQGGRLQQRVRCHHL